ncbi:MAG: SMP-30/gluconolactonase/LRE family protein [Oscillibacter sp.]|nr:SMP-30/gluconolactonase/LRE family protein [Oscillibacter sp.]
MKRLSEHVFLLAESPRFQNGGVTFTDIDEKKLYRWENGEVKMIWDKAQITAFIFDRNGGMVFANMEGLYRMRADGTYYPLAEGLKINDMGVDPAGRVLFGTNYHSREQSYPLGSLYSYDKENGLRELEYGYHLANGIGFSPDGTKLYVCDSSLRCVFEYPYDVKTGEIGRKRILIRMRMDDGMPDGMAIDEAGNVWTAQWYGRCVICTSPEGKELRRVAVPEAEVSAVEFTPQGLFITSSGKAGRLDIAPAAFSVDDPQVTGGVYLADAGVRGPAHALSDIPCK